MSSVFIRSGQRLVPLISPNRTCLSRLAPIQSYCTHPETSAPVNKVDKTSSFSFLKFGIGASLLGLSGATGYASYAYSADEIEEKTKNLRTLARCAAMIDDGTTLGKIQAAVYSTALAVPVRAVEIYLDLRRRIDEHLKDFIEPSSDKLLEDLPPQEQGVFTLVLDLNETLIYSDWKRERGWRTFKRPGVDAFLKHLSQFFEIVVYSDQLDMCVAPICDRLNENCGGQIRKYLNRSATLYQNGKHYRDLSKLNREPSRVIYISAHALENCLQPENCLEIKPWTSEPNDTCLVDLIPFLEYIATHRPADIRPVLTSYHGQDVGKEFIRRSIDYQRQMQEQKRQKRTWLR